MVAFSHAMRSCYIPQMSVKIWGSMGKWYKMMITPLIWWYSSFKHRFFSTLVITLRSKMKIYHLWQLGFPLQQWTLVGTNMGEKPSLDLTGLWVDLYSVMIYVFPQKSACQLHAIANSIGFLAGSRKRWSSRRDQAHGSDVDPFDCSSRLLAFAKKKTLK